MAERRNFLLGKGERLTEPVQPSGRKLDREPPYTFQEARNRLRPMFEEALGEMVRMPEAAKPKGEVVGSLTLNPEYIAKSYYPEQVLKFYKLRAVGSRPISITPGKRSKGRPPVERPTTQLFVAGGLSSFRHLIADLETGAIAESVRADLPAMESFAAPDPGSKIKGSFEPAKELSLEVVLHASEFRQDNYIITGFQEYLGSLGLEADLDHRIHAGGVCFLRMRSPSSALPDIASFAFLRAVRQMPRLRELPLRSLGRRGTATLPAMAAVDPTIRIAVFDGGVPEGSPLAPWVTIFDPPGIGAPVPEALDHGYAVTSAVLFGSLEQGEAPCPFANVQHVRVWDENSADDPLELYDVLERIRNTLDSSPKFDFINLSLGPSLPVDDDDVHAWTAVIDEYLADGTCVGTIAVGNSGESDEHEEGLNRIQVPADAVNGLSIGACDGAGDTWKRASYSSIGPGRSPGIVKPDLVAFGGCPETPYFVLGGTSGLSRIAQCGTSFAAPHTMRIGAGVKANFGNSLKPLAIRTLLVHTAEGSDEPQHEVGWGRVRDSIDDIVVCSDGSIRVVYQGELTASKYLRAEIPLPDGALLGMVKITATFCFATEIDSAHPGSYTRSGLEIFFRPHDEQSEEGALHARTNTFFSRSRLYQNEEKLRTDAHKWETCLHGCLRKRAGSLRRPVFDIHYLSRDEGRADRQTTKIKYALVITVETPRHPDLYDRVVRKYRNVLEPMMPLQLPIQL